MRRTRVVVVVTNPLEEMTHLMAKTTGFPPQRVIGMAGVLDSARFRSLVALTGVARPQDVTAIALGSHGPEMVIPLSQATVNGAAATEACCQPTRSTPSSSGRGIPGAEVVKLLQKGSAYFSPAESAAAMVVDMARDSGRVLAACVQSGGAYGIEDTRVGLPVRLGPRGVKEIVALPLTPAEKRGPRQGGVEHRGARPRVGMSRHASHRLRQTWRDRAAGCPGARTRCIPTTRSCG